ncbi:MAG: MFS transporter [Bacteroidetes bacterium]|nr:MFS transporter [Bacteroidota bacterium]
MAFLNQQERPGKVHFRILLLSWAGWVFDFYDLILYTFLMIPIKKEFGFSDIQISLVLGCSLAATAFGGIVFGWLSDRYGRKIVLQWTIITFSLGTFLSGFAQGIFALICFRIITGLGVGGEWGTGQTFIGETFPAKVRGRFGAFMQTGAPIGIALASIVGGYVTPIIGWRATFWVSVLPALLVVYSRKNSLNNSLSDLTVRPFFFVSSWQYLICRPIGLLIPGCRVIFTMNVLFRWQSRRFTYL